MKYYYLISSLPKLNIDDDSLSRDQLNDIIELITRNLADEDLAVMKCLLHDNDNQNLLSILFHEYHDYNIRIFSQPSSIPIEILKNYRLEFSSLPDYMMNYLIDFSGSFSSLTGSEMEQTLNRYFYDHLLIQDSLFLNSYFSWTFELEQTIAGLNLRSFQFLNPNIDSREFLFPKTQTLYDLPEQKEVANQLLPLIESRDIHEVERKINDFYWQFADSWKNPFSADQVFAYMVKLIRLYRWKGFSARGDAAKVSLESLVAEIKEKRASPKTPTV